MIDKYGKEVEEIGKIIDPAIWAK